MRPLVHDPTKTVSTATSRIGVPGVSAMYSRALRAATWSDSSVKSAGSGTAPPSGTPWPGLVPHVTKGVTSEASSTISLSKAASSSVRSVAQCDRAASHCSPFGASGLPSM